MSERRFDKHVLRIAKALAVAEGKSTVDKDVFIRAVKPALILRIIPLDVGEPHLYATVKKTISDRIVEYIDMYLSRDYEYTRILINTILSGKTPSNDILRGAVEEWKENPIALAVFIDFIDTALVSAHREEVMRLANTQTWLKHIVERLLRYENLDYM